MMTIKNLYLLFLVNFVWCSCSGPLDRNYFPGRLEADTKDILMQDAASDHEMFLINYALVKHRDYMNYEIEGQSFSNILENAKRFEKEGMDITYEFAADEGTEGLNVKTKNEGIGNKRVGSTSVLKKGLLFSCTFENTTGEDIFLENSTFQIYGPFKDHLTSVAYKIDFYIKKGEKKKINFFADGQNIQNNVKFGMDPTLRNTRIDEILMLSEVRNVSNKFYPKAYKDMNVDPVEGRFQASKSFLYERDLKGNEWVKKQGDKVILNLGKADIMN